MPELHLLAPPPWSDYELLDSGGAVRASGSLAKYWGSWSVYKTLGYITQRSLRFRVRAGVYTYDSNGNRVAEWNRWSAELRWDNGNYPV